ncbi:MAG: hypothetical protein AVDCRST_MAG03-1964, partial [uncultured Rubrobacteraceae bacterium]
ATAKRGTCGGGARLSGAGGLRPGRTSSRGILRRAHDRGRATPGGPGRDVPCARGGLRHLRRHGPFARRLEAHAQHPPHLAARLVGAGGGHRGRRPPAVLRRAPPGPGRIRARAGVRGRRGCTGSVRGVLLGARRRTGVGV